MSLIEKIKRKRKRLKYGIDTGREVLLQCIDKLCNVLFHVSVNNNAKARVARLRKEFWNDEDKIYQIKDAKIPALDTNDERLFLLGVIYDSFASYIYFDDRYDEEIVNLCEDLFGEGIYGLVNDTVNVTVEVGDIVIDAGSWIGDFAAYASVKGATTYAFEPTDSLFAIIQKTAELNGNIFPVRKGLSNDNTSTTLFVSKDSWGNSLMARRNLSASSSVETVRLDDFVRENNLQRVDFIKADIEGFERYMLEGAQETLKRFAPKLALCTYHLPDDPEVMASLIKQANPKYNIVQKRMKLFASVPE